MTGLIWLLALSAAIVILIGLLGPARNAYAWLRYEGDVRFVPYAHNEPATGYPIESELHRERVLAGAYAFPPFDSAGIPVVDYRWMRQADMPKGRFTNPTTVAQYALWGCFLPWVRCGDAALFDEFLVQADWLLAAQDADGAYRSEFPLDSRGLGEGWVSALHQGQAASVLVRAYSVTGETRYLEGARRAVSLMLLPLASGGTLSVDADGTWLEEYPEQPPSHVLNGLIFGWYGLQDFVDVTGDVEATRLRDAIASTLARCIDRYTSPHGVRYELKRSFVVDGGSYLPLQICQLESLTYLTGDPEFARVAGEWALRWNGPRHLSLVGVIARSLVSAAGFRLAQAKLALRVSD